MYGRILRQLRESKDRTQADVARSVGISPAHLARLEAGTRGLYLDDFIKIVEVLGEKPGNLLANNLGDIAHLKPLIDRLAVVRAEFFSRVATIVETAVQIAERATAPSKKKAVRSRTTAARGARRRGER